MAAPTPCTKPTLPAGAPMPNGFPAFICNSAAPGLLIWPKSIQPMGIDNQEPIDIVNYFNEVWRTKAPNALTDIPDMTMTVEYSSSSYAISGTTIGVPATITIFLPDNGTIAFFGWYSKFIPEKLEEKKQPMAEITIVCSNYDYLNCIEAGPEVSIGSTCYTSHPY